MRMLRNIVSVWLMLFNVRASLQAQSPADSTSISTTQVTNKPKEWGQDLDFLVKEIARRHPDPFTKISKKEFLASAEALRVSIAQSTDNQIVVALMRLIARIGDSHTRVSDSPDAPFHYVPLGLRSFRDGVFVIAAEKKSRHLIGRKLIKLGGVPWTEASSRLETIRAAETLGWKRDMLCATATYGEVLHGLALAGSSDRATLTLLDALGVASDVTLEAPANSQGLQLVGTNGDLKVPDYGGRRDGLRNWCTMVQGQPLLYIRYFRCADEPTQTVDSFCSKAVKIIEESKPLTILVDLRGNTGGSSSLLNPLIEYFRKHSEFKGRLFVAVSGTTFSSGVMNAYDLKKAGGILIGEPTGSPLNHFGETRSFALPNSKLLVFHSTRRWVLDRTYRDNQPLEVDIPITESSSEWFAGKDPVLIHLVSMVR